MEKQFGTLRQYQERLLARINAQRTTGPASSYLAVEVGGLPWVLRLSDVSEVMPIPVITTVPNTRPWFRGITNVRGVLHSVVDLAHFLGADPTPVDSTSRLVLLGRQYRLNSGILVSRSLGLRNPDALGQANASAHPWAEGEFRDPDGVQWKLLNVRALCVAPSFIEIGIVADAAAA